MKKNLVKKLALSAITMGVAAVTVTTTTYAWFTANQKASATGMSGEVTKADSGNLLISKTDSNYLPTVQLNDGSTTLQPVQMTTAGAYTLKSDSAAAASDFTRHSLWFKVTDLDGSESVSKYQLKLKLADVRFSEAKTQTLLGNDGSVSVSLKDVLGLQVTRGANDEFGVAGAYRYVSEDTSSTTRGTENDALNYYNRIMGANDSRPEGYDAKYSNTVLYTGTAYNEIVIAEITRAQVNAATNGEIKINLNIDLFVDGWDNQCFNAIGGQTITGGTFAFELVKVDATNNG